MTPYDEVEYRKAIAACIHRYEAMAEVTFASDNPLNIFITEFKEKMDSYPVPKLCRWLGYIQGVLINSNVTTVDRERDWTRPYFRPLDFTNQV